MQRYFTGSTRPNVGTSFSCRATSRLYHQSDRDKAEYAILKCWALQAIVPTPATISTGLDALLEPLAVTSMPIRVVAAPMLPTTDPRKLLEL